MKILIVDDEVFVRIGIKTTFDWDKYGYEIVGEAEDGIEAVEMFNKYKPDIVLVDIMMPRMSGLDFIKEVRASNSFCRFIVLSCHNEFDYVREAMKLGVRDYIIKTTVKRDEFLEIVNGIAAEIQADRNMLDAIKVEKQESNVYRPIVVKDYLNAVIDGFENDEARIAAKIAGLQVELSVPNLYIILLSLDYQLKINKEYEPESYEQVILGIINIAQEILKRYGKVVVVKRNNRETVGLVSVCGGADKPAIFKELFILSEDIAKAVREFLNIGVSIGISEEIRRFTDISRVYVRTAEMLERRFFSGPSSIIVYQEAGDNGKEFMETLACLEKDALNSIRQFDFEKAELLLQEAKYSVILKQGQDHRLVKSVFLNLVMSVYKLLNDEFPGRDEKSELALYTAEIMEAEYFVELIDCVCLIIHCKAKVFDDRYSSSNKNMISKVIEYVHQNPGTDITLNDAADYVSLSPGHFSRLFKKLTGENFIDYIIKLKMEKAKSLIRSGEKLWSISLKLGYSEISSFSRIFKRIEGLSPRQYRMKYHSTEHIDIK